MTFYGARARVAAATGLAGDGVTTGEMTTAINDALTALAIPANLTDMGDVDLTGIATNDLVRWDGTKLVKYTPAAITVSIVLPYVIEGGGSAISTGLRYGFRVNFAGKITGWDLGSDQDTTSSVQVWKDTTANFPPVVGDLILTMSTVAGTRYGSATGLDIAFSNGDWFFFNVSVNNNATVLLPNINCTREVGP